MPVFKSEMSEPKVVDESTTQAANAAQFVAEEGAELDEGGVELGEEVEVSGAQPDQPEEQPVEDAVSGDRNSLQTREAYLKKGEDLIRSLL
jgi:hypothetical protein